MLTENDIARIARRIVEAYAPLVVGSFGSYAIGSAHDRSDLDLFVIKETCERPAARAQAVRRKLLGVFHPLDIHVFTSVEFEETVYTELSFTWVIARQARLYHWAEEARRLVPSLLLRSPRMFRQHEVSGEDSNPDLLFYRLPVIQKIANADDLHICTVQRRRQSLWRTDMDLVRRRR